MDCKAIKPLGHRIVVIPDRAPEMTTSGLYIPEAHNDIPPMSGIVQTLGDGPERDKRIRARAIARCLSILDEASIEAATNAEALILAKEEIGRYLRDSSEQTHICEVGQRVIFPMEAGHEIVIGEDTENAVVIVAEDAVLAVWDSASVAA